MRRVHSAAPRWMHEASLRQAPRLRLDRVLSTLHPLLAGRRFREVRRQIETSQWWTAERLQESQLQRARAMLGHAERTSTFYAEMLAGLGATACDIRTWSDFRNLPLVSKEDIRERHDAMLSRSVPPRARSTCMTSGTTSVYVNVTEPQDAWGFEHAFFHRWYGWMGYRYGVRAAVISSLPDRKPREFNPLANVMDVYLMGPDTKCLDSAIDALRTFSPRVVRGLPSWVTLLSERLLERDDGGLPSVTHVFFMSEKPLKRHYEAAEHAFGVRPVVHYGQAERVALAQQCPASDVLHVIPEYSHVELLRPDGSHIDTPGETGMIVGTSFANYALPLVRYRTDDWATLSSTGRCSACGREFWSLSSVDGRTGDFIRTRSGRWWSPAALDWGGPYGRWPVVEGQLRQTSLDDVEILMVPGKDFDPSYGDAWAEALRGLLDEPGLRVTVRLVDCIERPASMKQRFVVGLDTLEGIAGC
jgi:phenylacetate-CoA ligase